MQKVQVKRPRGKASTGKKKKKKKKKKNQDMEAGGFANYESLTQGSPFVKQVIIATIAACTESALHMSKRLIIYTVRAETMRKSPSTKKQ